MDYRDWTMVVIVMVVLSVLMLKAWAGELVDAATCTNHPVVYHDEIYDVDVYVVETNRTIRGLGWCAPPVLPGEPPVVTYSVYLNGAIIKDIGATGQATETEGWQESVPFDDYLLRRDGSTNLLWVTCSNDQGAQSNFSQAIGLVVTKPRAPMNLTIYRTLDGVAMKVDNIPPDTREIEVEMTEDMLAWTKAAHLSLRGSFDSE